jgi:hypothetical protein
MWTFSQSTGSLARVVDGVTKVWGTGYAGLGLDKDNPADQAVVGQGPIPEGAWTIGEAHNDPTLGQHVMALSPRPGTVTFGRSGFFIHGDSLQHPGAASHGCLVLSYALREEISFSGDIDLTVTA